MSEDAGIELRFVSLFWKLSFVFDVIALPWLRVISSLFLHKTFFSTTFREGRAFNKFDIFINKRPRIGTKLLLTVPILPSNDEITRFDGTLLPYLGDSLFCNFRYSATLTSQTYAYLLRFLESSQSHLILNILNQVSSFSANTLISYEVRVHTSVADPDPSDINVFGPPVSGSVSAGQMSGSGTFYL